MKIHVAMLALTACAILLAAALFSVILLISSPDIADKAAEALGQGKLSLLVQMLY